MHEEINSLLESNPGRPDLTDLLAKATRSIAGFRAKRQAHIDRAAVARAASEALLVRDPVLGEWGYDPTSPWVLLFTEADRKGDAYFCAGPPDTR